MIPAPGVYPGLPAPEYFAWIAASNTALGKLRRSPAHCWAYLNGHDKDTKAKASGRPIHTAVLEPDSYDSRYLIAEQCGAVTGKGERCKNTGNALHVRHGWACGTHSKDGGAYLPAGVEVVTEEERAVHLAVRDSVLHNPLGRVLLSRGQAELALAWRDPDVGVLCKGRLDWYDRERATVVDLKSTADAGRRAFELAVWKWGYHRQGPFYLGGARANDLPAEHFSILAVEKEPPYAVAVYRLEDDVVRQARPHLLALMDEFNRCMESGVWPGYPEEVQDLSIPSWAWSLMDDEAAEITNRSAA